MLNSVRQHLIWLLPLVVALGAGCGTVTEQMSPDAEAGRPPAEGTYLRDAEVTTAPAEGDWWGVFGDPTLTSLMARLNRANPDVAAAAARVDRSFAVLGITASSKSPTLRGSAGGGRRRDSVNNLVFPVTVREYSQYRLGMNASWEVDLWGRVRGMTQRDGFLAGAEAALYEDLLLSLQANLAQQYFAWRSAETEVAILEESRQHWEENLKLEEARLEFGDGVAADVSRARLQLQTAAAALEAARRNSGTLLHSIATLTGALPAEMGDALETQRASGTEVPVVPAGLPSELLVRRPDLLAADRQLRAAAIQVGIRKADFLPRITLVGNGGFASLNADNLVAADSIFFDLGPQIDIPVFQGGVRKSAVAQARAQWREASANFKSTFLTAVREVDDALLEVKSYARELGHQEEAVRSAARTAEEARDRHEFGLASYFEFVEAEQSRLETRLRENALRSQHRIAAVRLIQSLGGSWWKAESGGSEGAAGAVGRPGDATGNPPRSMTPDTGQ